jgi:putative endopeptidase
MKVLGPNLPGGLPVPLSRTPQPLIALPLLLALAACDAAPPPATHAPATTGDGRAIDESRLPPTLRFAAADLDPAKDVCGDFFGHVNDKWLAANPIPADRSSWGPSAMLAERSLAVRRQLAERAAADPAAAGIEKIVGDLWATGMDETAIEAQGLAPLAGRLAEIDALTDAESVAAHLRTAAARGEGTLFAFQPEADFKNSTMTIGYALQGGLGLPDKGYYFDADKREKLEAYERHVARVLELSGLSAEAAAAQARAVLAFETRLAGASKSSEELSRDIALYYNPVSPAEADLLTPRFPWSRFLESQGVALPDRFSLAIPGFHREVDAMLGDEPVAAWRAYLRFHLVDAASPFLSAPFVEANYEFYGKTLRGQQEIQARWKRVLEAIEQTAGEAMGQLYVEVAFPPESKRRMEALVANLGTALKGRLEALDWMSEETKGKALAKWATFTPKIGYPDKWRDFSGLRTGRESYFANVSAANELNYRWQLGKIGKPVDKTEWGMTPQTVNAYYNPLQNEIVFPAAILQPPFFDAGADEAMNYGAIGAVIGHEMTHGYDDQGSRFGASGNFENWWTAADAAGFAARSERLVKQFDAYEALPGRFVNGKLTLGENIADLGGLATAYDAMVAATADAPDPMTDGLTRAQRFFLAYGTAWRAQMTPETLEVLLASNPHAPAKFRAIGPPSNLSAFAAAFACEPGEPMARPEAERVVIW